MGSGPGYFQFHGNKAFVQSSEQDAQKIIDHAKQYVEMANENYQNDLGINAKHKEYLYREKLRQEQANAEARVRVLGNLKV
jgi:hypothetical protein